MGAGSVRLQPSCGVLRGRDTPPAPCAQRGELQPAAVGALPRSNAPTSKTRAVVFLAGKETKSQTFSTLISLSCVLLLIPPHGHWSSDRRALQRIKGLLCSAVRGCRPLVGWCNQILPVPCPCSPSPCTSPCHRWCRGRDRAGTEATSSTFPSLPLHGQVCPELNLPF